ncbi:cytidine deaminase-like fold-containing protein [Snodgrassella communis]|uniref:YD repeat n=1 Tax=Snodgrassella communis TaxID=2946699 RepID=A0A836Z5B9_9NEIS|nr:RHS repeat-associated core domain-containing protein [Snodgrassella communis]KDN13839.1 YD repeat [Snodgrassella communis]
MLIMIMAQIAYASVKLPNTEYTENTVDMRVKVLGGEVKLKRTWENGRWYLNPAWAELRFVLDPLDNSVKTIDRAGTLYQRSGTADLYTFHQVSIRKTDSGWRWTDPQGNWIDYDSKGRPLAYGDASNVKVSFELDKDGRRKAIKDHNGELVYSLDYDNKEHLIKATDRSGRSVSYSWSGDQLTKVTDVMGNVWKYGYDKNGQLNSKTEPDGGITKIDYVLSVPSLQMFMDSGRNGGKISQSTVVNTGAADHENKLARVGKITAKTGAVTVYNTEYNRVNKQYTITVNDPLGIKTVNVFDSQGRLLSKTVNNELKLRYEQDTVTNQVKIFNERGIATIVQKDSEERPIKIIAADGSTENYQYNTKGMLTKHIDAGGNVTELQYNDQNKVIQIIQAKGKPEQRIISWEYDRYGQANGIKSGKKQIINLQQTLDKYGNISSYTDANGNTYQFTHNIQGQVTSVKTPDNNIWQLSYNAAGIPEQAIDPQGKVTKYSSDALGRITKITDPLGNTTSYSYQYNNQGWQVKATDALNQTYTYNYDLAGKPVSVISPSGLEIKQSYDKQGRPKSQQDSAGNITSVEYGNKGSGLDGLIVKTLYPTYTETYNYNTIGLPTSVSQVLDNNISLMTSISYNEQGLPASITNPDGSTFMARYDAYGNIIKTIDALGGEISNSWDEMGNLESITDPGGRSYTFSYDNNGNLIKETGASGNQTEYIYNTVDQLIAQKDANGNEIHYQYDQTGNLIEESYFAKGQTTAEQRITYSYNDAGQLTGVNQSGDTQSSFNYVLDKLGRRIKETITYQSNNQKISKELKYSYDADGNLASITYPDNSVVQYHYAQGQLQQVQLPNGEQITWDRYRWNQPESITAPGSKTSMTYTALQQPLSIRVINADNKVLLQRNYQYDKSGNIIQSNTEQGIIDYRYDALDRLTQVNPDQSLQQKGLPVESYSYDATGNRTGSAHQTGEWQYNSNGQLTQWGEGKQQTALSYDATGNLISEQLNGKQRSYQYDSINQLISIQDGDTEKAHYQYDPFGRRISKTVNGETTYYLYSDEGLIAELDQNGTMQVAYGWMPDTVWGTSPLWQASLDNNQTLKNADYHYLITDYLGTPQLAVNSRGQQTWKGIADAFGNTQLDPDNQITLNLRQPGQYYDQESGLYYNFARHYNPQTGRYIEADPLGVGGGLNLYGYANANPLIYMDPYGLYAWANFVDDASNFSAGFGDAVSLGATKWIRKEYDIGSVNECSGWYNVGHVGGMIVNFYIVNKATDFVVGKAAAYVTAYKAARKPVVTAELKIGGRTFKDYNQNARAARSKRKADPNKKTLIHDQVAKREKKTGKSKPNGDMSSAHAEIGALQQAADKGVTKGADAVMKVTGKDLCDYCQKDVVAMAKASKLNSLKIYAETDDAYKFYEWEAGMARFKITETPK